MTPLVMRPATARFGLRYRLSGISLPTCAAIARNTADNCIAAQMDLAARADAVSINIVAADLPQGSGADCPHRYSSPDRRRRAFVRTPPLFSFRIDAWPHRRELAQNAFGRGLCFDPNAILPFDIDARRAHKKRGRATCTEQSKNNLRQYSSSYSYRHWWLAATPLSSRRPLVASAVLERRQFLTVTLRPAQPSAPRATSPIVRPSRTAAARTQNHAPQSWPFSLDHPCHLCADGPFCFKTQA